jgi:tetratricopeptide (TPR) repeat protein
MGEQEPETSAAPDAVPDLGEACETARRELFYRHLPTAAGIAEGLLAAYPDSTSAHELMGDVLMAQGKRNAARESYKRAMELEPANADAERKFAEATLFVQQADRTRELLTSGDLTELRGAGSKDASSAAVRSMFFPGLGQLYNGEYEKGLVAVLAGLPLFGLALWGLVEVVTSSTMRATEPMGAGQMALSFIGMFGYASLLAWSIWDAHRTASAGAGSARDGGVLPPS